MNSVADIKADYDWQEAFKFGEKPRGVLGYTGNLDAVSIDDIAEVIGVSNGENDGANWIGAFILNDGRYAFVSAGCDYTGWDCQAGGDAQVASDRESLIRWAMGDEDRARLALPLEAPPRVTP